MTKNNFNLPPVQNYQQRSSFISNGNEGNVSKNFCVISSSIPHEKSTWKQEKRHNAILFFQFHAFWTPIYPYYPRDQTIRSIGGSRSFDESISITQSGRCLSWLLLIPLFLLLQLLISHSLARPLILSLSPSRPLVPSREDSPRARVVAASSAYINCRHLETLLILYETSIYV